MKSSLFLLAAVLLFSSCSSNNAQEASQASPGSMVGTWKLLSGTLIEKGDTTVTDYTKNTSFIKVINDTHFAFLQHDLSQGKDSAVFVSGGGRYSLKGDSYTEHLEYCSAREWEGKDFTFTLTMNKDTLIQRGVEKVESQGINRLNIEKYIKITK